MIICSRFFRARRSLPGGTRKNNDKEERFYNFSSFIVENPEAHLHPAGQSKIGFFLAQMADAGVQIVLETNSEHVVNGIRLYALKNAMSAESICINYFTTSSEGTSVQRIPLNDKMDIMKWPEGFFDQEEKDLQELRHLRRNS